MKASWIKIPSDSDFPLENIPLGICRKMDGDVVVCTRIGDTIIDLRRLSELDVFGGCGIADFSVFGDDSLNRLMSLGKGVSSRLRLRIMELFAEGSEYQTPLSEKGRSIYCPASEVEMLLPVKIGDYTDFYSSREHAYNVGCMFRDPANALLPNWLHIPVAYHGRSSSIVVSDTPIYRPYGQSLPEGHSSPVFGPTKQLDFELEMAFVIGHGNTHGKAVSTENAEEHIFGMMVFNDLSARDFQKWEYVPLGPFLSKNFASVVSPWIVTLDALEPFRCAGPVQEPQVLKYLQTSGKKTFDIHLEVWLQAKGCEAIRISLSNFRYLYWNMSQQLAHHTVNGCNMRTGDICASGTISGPDRDSRGSMLEITWKGTEPITLPDGSQRSFLEDGDTIIMKAYAQNESLRIGFGESRVKILPSHQP